MGGPEACHENAAFLGQECRAYPRSNVYGVCSGLDWLAEPNLMLLSEWEAFLFAAA